MLLLIIHKLTSRQSPSILLCLNNNVLASSFYLLEQTILSLKKIVTAKDLILIAPLSKRHTKAQNMYQIGYLAFLQSLLIFSSIHNMFKIPIILLSVYSLNNKQIFNNVHRRRFILTFVLTCEKSR